MKKSLVNLGHGVMVNIDEVSSVEIIKVKHEQPKESNTGLLDAFKNALSAETFCVDIWFKNGHKTTIELAYEFETYDIMKKLENAGD